MKKTERAKVVKKNLDRLYPDPKVPLKHTSTYTLLIAVLLSAQCTDERVNKITPHLFSKAKTPRTMVKLTIAQIEKIIGLPIGAMYACGHFGCVFASDPPWRFGV